MVTGKAITTGFSGNAYFNPFVWDGIHIFDFFYDPEGRVVLARAHDDRGQLEFTWDEKRLVKVIKRSDRTSDASIVYTRTLDYSGNRLVSETIVSGGRTSRII